jgi:predicted negative regulator of RcsB-dependent stress response
MQSATKTPAQWAKAKGHVLSSFYGATAALHGWTDHEHHAGEPMQLTAEQYDGAIAAVKTGFVPHGPALSMYAPETSKQALREAVEKATESSEAEQPAVPAEEHAQ